MDISRLGILVWANAIFKKMTPPFQCADLLNTWLLKFYKTRITTSPQISTA